MFFDVFYLTVAQIVTSEFKLLSEVVRLGEPEVVILYGIPPKYSNPDLLAIWSPIHSKSWTASALRTF